MEKNNFVKEQFVLLAKIEKINSNTRRLHKFRTDHKNIFLFSSITYYVNSHFSRWNKLHCRYENYFVRRRTRYSEAEKKRYILTKSAELVEHEHYTFLPRCTNLHFSSRHNRSRHNRRPLIRKQYPGASEHEQVRPAPIKNALYPTVWTNLHRPPSIIDLQKSFALSITERRTFLSNYTRN